MPRPHRTLVLKECHDENTFSKIVDCMWPSYNNPYHPFMQILFPVFLPTVACRTAAIVESKTRLWKWHTEDPSSRWVCVEDTDTGEVVGGAQWNFYEKNPFGGLGWGGEEDQDARAVRAQNGGKPKRESMVADWWPEGDGRVFAEDVLEQVYGPRRGKMCRPHALCNLMFVHPSHRRLGAGSLLFNYGVHWADAHSPPLETFVEATGDGLHLYESCGMTVMYVDHVDKYLREGDKTDERRKLEWEMGHMKWWFMWRKPGGEAVTEEEKMGVGVPWQGSWNRR